MTFFLDNNLSPVIPTALRILGESACHLQDNFKPDAKDIEWIPFVAERKMALITLDLRITKVPLEVGLLKKFNIKAFFLEGKSMDGWSRILQIFRAWKEMQHHALNHRPPHIFKVNRQGTKIYAPQQP
jgi:predicted nuclease of predicted toxin-antitoxin system